MNPLLKDFNTPFDTIPFEKIVPEHFSPAFEQAFTEARQEIREIQENNDHPDFRNCVEKLEIAGERLGRLSALLFNLNHAETNESIQQLARETAPLLTAFHNDISLDPVLFSKIKAVYRKRKSYQLAPEQEKLLEDTFRNFVRSGANLDDEAKEEFRRITGRLSELSVRFSENVLAETNIWFLHLEKENDLKGLPESVIQQATQDAEQRKLPGWVFTLQYPSYMPFIKYAENRELRKRMFLASGQRGLRDNKFDNREIIREMVNLRCRMANLLGFGNYAAFVLDNRMAEKQERVYDLLGTLRDAALPAARSEVEELREYAASLQIKAELMPWDWAYYAEKLREKQFSISDEITRPYFELAQSVQAVFNLAGKLYGIQFIKTGELETYHPETEVFEVRDENNEHLAILYMDYFPRAGKKPGAWMTEFKPQYVRSGVDQRPHISLVFNFPRPTNQKPSLLSYNELRTLLHEFGHALHGVFSCVSYQSLSGTSVYRDFVELPSQIMENWAEQKAWLQESGKHFQTGEAIPEALIDKLLAARNFHVGYMTCRQLSFGFLDMAWHSLRETFSSDIIQFEKEVMEPLRLLHGIEEVAMSPSFNHIFGGGYAAGYYGYKWAEVLDADAFSRFLEEGIFNTETASDFRQKILSRGGTEHPMKLYKDFMGREPRIEALLERSGLKAT